MRFILGICAVSLVLADVAPSCGPRETHSSSDPKADPVARPAQTIKCEPGQKVRADTDGHCCWPGQLWSSPDGRCVGPPERCPETFVRQGETCVRLPGQ